MALALPSMGVGDQLGNPVDAARGQVRIEGVLDQPFQLSAGVDDHLAGGVMSVGDTGCQASRDRLGVVRIERRVHPFEQLTLGLGERLIELMGESGELPLDQLDMAGDAHGAQAGRADGYSTAGDLSAGLGRGIGEERDDIAPRHSTARSTTLSSWTST